jgi:hypothetical protein
MYCFLQAPIENILQCTLHNRPITNIAVLANHWKLLSDSTKEELKKSNCTIFLDNMIFEGNPISVDDYVSIINEMKPDYFVLPDSFGNIKETFNLHTTYWDKINDDLKSGAIAVVNDPMIPKDYELWIKKNVKLIGVPYFGNQSRMYTLELVTMTFLDHNIHLLGMSTLSSYIKYSYLSSVFNIFSSDSSLVYTSTKAGCDFTYGVYKKDTISSDLIYDPDLDMKLFQKNIEWIASREWEL